MEVDLLLRTEMPSEFFIPGFEGAGMFKQIFLLPALRP